MWGFQRRRKLRPATAVLAVCLGWLTTRAAGADEPESSDSRPATTAEAERPGGSEVAQAENDDAPLRVAVAGSAPFVVPSDDGELGGFALELWRALGEDAPRTEAAELVPFPSVDAALEAVRQGEADVALGPISITAERARHLSFSQPYYISALSILAPATQSLWARLAPFATRAFGAGLFLLLMVLGGVGTLLWLCERKANSEQFSPRPVPGIANGIWLSLVTMTTVGYGDLAPVTRRGRVVAGVWMLVAMLTASSLTASIATALTLSQLETPGISKVSDLDGKSVAVMDPSPAAEFVRDAGGRVVQVSNVEQGVQAVNASRAKAVVWDRPVLSYFLKQHPNSVLTLSSTRYHPHGYGIAARHEESELLRSIDLAILRLVEGDELDRMRQRWLPE